MSIFSTSLEREFIDIGAFAAELSGAEQLTALANVASRESAPIEPTGRGRLIPSG